MGVYKGCTQCEGYSRLTKHLLAPRLQFLVLQDKSIPSVPHLLRNMLAQRQFGGLGVHWRVFGSNGHIQPPEQGVLQVRATVFCNQFCIQIARQSSDRAGRPLFARAWHRSTAKCWCPALQAFTSCTPLQWEQNKLLKTLANTDYAVRPVA